MSAPTRLRFDEMPPSQQAGIMCNDPRFQQFVGAHTIESGVTIAASGCAEYISTICNINSRRDLNTNQDAHNKFQSLRTEFDAWTGKIANPRQ